MEEERQDRIVGAIRRLREQVRWRRGRDVQHLAKVNPRFQRLGTLEALGL